MAAVKQAQTAKGTVIVLWSRAVSMALVRSRAVNAMMTVGISAAAWGASVEAR